MSSHSNSGNRFNKSVRELFKALADHLIDDIEPKPYTTYEEKLQYVVDQIYKLGNTPATQVLLDLIKLISQYHEWDIIIKPLTGDYNPHKKTWDKPRTILGGQGARHTMTRINDKGLMVCKVCGITSQKLAELHSQGRFSTSCSFEHKLASRQFIVTESFVNQLTIRLTQLVTANSGIVDIKCMRHLLRLNGAVKRTKELIILRQLGVTPGFNSTNYVPDHFYFHGNNLDGMSLRLVERPIIGSLSTELVLELHLGIIGSEKGIRTHTPSYYKGERLITAKASEYKWSDDKYNTRVCEYCDYSKNCKVQQAIELLQWLESTGLQSVRCIQLLNAIYIEQTYRYYIKVFNLVASAALDYSEGTTEENMKHVIDHLNQFYDTWDELSTEYANMYRIVGYTVYDWAVNVLSYWMTKKQSSLRDVNYPNYRYLSIAPVTPNTRDIRPIVLLNFTSLTPKLKSEYRGPERYTKNDMAPIVEKITDRVQRLMKLRDDSDVTSHKYILQCEEALKTWLSMCLEFRQWRNNKDIKSGMVMYSSEGYRSDTQTIAKLYGTKDLPGPSSLIHKNTVIGTFYRTKIGIFGIPKMLSSGERNYNYLTNYTTGITLKMDGQQARMHICLNVDRTCFIVLFGSKGSQMIPTRYAVDTGKKIDRVNFVYSSLKESLNSTCTNLRKTGNAMKAMYDFLNMNDAHRMNVLRVLTGYTVYTEIMSSGNDLSQLVYEANSGIFGHTIVDSKGRMVPRDTMLMMFKEINLPVVRHILLNEKYSLKGFDYLFCFRIGEGYVTHNDTGSYGKHKGCLHALFRITRSASVEFTVEKAKPGTIIVKVIRSIFGLYCTLVSPVITKRIALFAVCYLIGFQRCFYAETPQFIKAMHAKRMYSFYVSNFDKILHIRGFDLSTFTRLLPLGQVFDDVQYNLAQEIVKAHPVDKSWSYETYETVKWFNNKISKFISMNVRRSVDTTLCMTPQMIFEKRKQLKKFLMNCGQHRVPYSDVCCGHTILTANDIRRIANSDPKKCFEYYDTFIAMKYGWKNYIPADLPLLSYTPDRLIYVVKELPTHDFAYNKETYYCLSTQTDTIHKGNYHLHFNLDNFKALKIEMRMSDNMVCTCGPMKLTWITKITTSTGYCIDKDSLDEIGTFDRMAFIKHGIMTLSQQ